MPEYFISINKFHHLVIVEILTCISTYMCTVSQQEHLYNVIRR